VEFNTEIHRALRLYRRHPFLNTAPREGVDATAFGKQVSFNSLGYRSPERSRRKSAGEMRIVFSGGSTTFDLLSVDDSHSWPWRIETILRSRGQDVEVFNAGFPGWTSLENLISLTIRDLDLSPDVVVLYQGINDLQPASHQPFDRQYERGHAEMAERALGFQLQPLRWYDRSLLVEKSRELVIGELDPWKRLKKSYGARERMLEIPTVALATFERNVRAYLSVAISAGAQVVLVTQPIRVRSGSEEADRAYLEGWIEGLEPTAVPAQLERLNDVMRSIAQEGPAFLIDAVEGVAWDDRDFADPMHFSARGSERMAIFMADSLEHAVYDGVGSDRESARALSAR